MLPIAPINKQVYDKFADLSTILWAQIKIDSPTYLNFEISYLPPNTDQESVLKSHLKRYWNLAAPSTNRPTYNAMSGFFEFIKVRGEPITGRIVWAVLAYFQHKRSELLTLYDIRVAKQNKLEDKIAAKPVEKSHFTSFMYSFKNSSDLPAWGMFQNRI